VRTIQTFDADTGEYRTVDDASGRWNTRGLELIAEARPLPGLDLSGSLTWQTTEDRANDIDPGYSPSLLAKLKASYSRGRMTYAAYGRYVDAMDADWDFVTGPSAGCGPAHRRAGARRLGPRPEPALGQGRRVGRRGPMQRSTSPTCSTPSSAIPPANSSTSNAA
jgi:hypothetical protein